MSDFDLTDRVRGALVNAKENGYDMAAMAPLEVALDLLDYDADLENEDIQEVATAVHIIRMNG